MTVSEDQNCKTKVMLTTLQLTVPLDTMTSARGPMQNFQMQVLVVGKRDFLNFRVLSSSLTHLNSLLRHSTHD